MYPKWLAWAKQLQAIALSAFFRVLFRVVPRDYSHPLLRKKTSMIPATITITPQTSG